MLWFLEVMIGSAIGGVLGHYVLVPVLTILVGRLRQWMLRRKLPAILAEFEAQHQQALASLDDAVTKAKATETDPERLEALGQQEAMHRHMLEVAYQGTRQRIMAEAGVVD